MKRKLLVVAAAAMVWGVTGCLNSGAVEPVLNQNRGSASPSRESTVTREYTSRPVAAAYDDSAVLRELATVKSDLRVAQEDLQKLIFRLEILERESQAKDRQLAELQSLVGAMDGQFAAADKQWSERMENLRRNMESERADRQRDMERMSSAMATEIATMRNSGSSSRSSIPADMKTVEIEVCRGDTLSTIAQKAKTTVKILKELNGLKNDNIRVGQKLRVPLVN